MKRLLIVALVFALAACTHPDFDGQFVRKVTYNFTNVSDRQIYGELKESYPNLPEENIEKLAREKEGQLIESTLNPVCMHTCQAGCKDSFLSYESRILEEDFTCTCFCRKI